MRLLFILVLVIASLWRAFGQGQLSVIRIIAYSTGSCTIRYDNFSGEICISFNTSVQ